MQKVWGFFFFFGVARVLARQHMPELCINICICPLSCCDIEDLLAAFPGEEKIDWVGGASG